MEPAEKLDVLQGTLDLLILRTLQWGAQHGHGIGQVIRSRSDELLQVEHGSLYPALHRLRREGWIESEWGTTQNHQRAKFYRLTRKGRKQLAREETKWKLFVKTMARVMRPQAQVYTMRGRIRLWLARKQEENDLSEAV